MAFRLYKEGQGSKARGVVAVVVALLGLLAATGFYDFMVARDFAESSLLKVPFFNWSIDFASLAAIVLFGLFVVFGVWMYNHPKLSDFLIETENELKNKVTWPTKRETFTNSLVVVVTCVLLTVWIVVADGVFDFVKGIIYGTG